MDDLPAIFLVTGAIAVGGGIAYLWLAFRAQAQHRMTEDQPSVPNDEKSSLLSVSNQVLGDETNPSGIMVPSDLRTVYEMLSRRDPFTRFVAVVRHFFLAKQALGVIKTNTTLLEAEAQQRLKLLTHAITLQNLHNEASLLPLKQIQDLSAVLARIAENRLSEATALAGVRKLSSPALPPAAKDPLQETEKRWRQKLEHSVVGLQAIYDKLEREGKERFRDNPKLLRIYSDALAQLFEDDQAK